MISVDNFINDNRADMLANIKKIVAELQKDMSRSPNEYTESEHDEPSVDIRLCIDLDETSRCRSVGWIFRTGLVDYDPYHSDFCSSDCITLDTEAKDLLDRLIDGIEEVV